MILLCLCGGLLRNVGWEEKGNKVLCFLLGKKDEGIWDERMIDEYNITKPTI